MKHLSLPLRLRKGYFDKVDMHESLRHSIGLILATRAGSIPFNRDYGCAIWDKEYSDLHTASKADVRASLRNAIDRFERRLFNLSVSFSAIDESGIHPLGLAVTVSGSYKEDGEEKEFRETFKIG